MSSKCGKYENMPFKGLEKAFKGFLKAFKRPSRAFKRPLKWARPLF